jgi:hypothetical protein
MQVTITMPTKEEYDSVDMNLGKVEDLPPGCVELCRSVNSLLTYPRASVSRHEHERR